MTDNPVRDGDDYDYEERNDLEDIHWPETSMTKCSKTITKTNIATTTELTTRDAMGVQASLRSSLDEGYFLKRIMRITERNPGEETNSQVEGAVAVLLAVVLLPLSATIASLGRGYHGHIRR
jgi:hypothetical protein